jgi:hypothetical protein
MTSITSKRITEKEIVMKTTTLFRLGGIAVLLPAILYGINSLIHFLSGQEPTALVFWIAIFADAFFVLGLGALFARQSHRGGILGLVGYVLLVWARMYFAASDAVSLGVLAGVISNEEIAQVPSYALSSPVMPWVWAAGLIVFGISIYRAQVFPKYAGALLVLVGLLQPLTGPLAFTRPIYAACYFIGLAWLGWILLMDKSVVSRDPIPVT